MAPIEYSGANAAVVEAYEARDPIDQSGDYWSADEVKPVKAAIKAHYIAEQKRVCCYCAGDLGTSNQGNWDCEHVIARSTHPRWLFTPGNLAVACKDCNLAKSDEPVLANKRRKTWPTRSTDYVIVHPYLDRYDDHIRWVGTVPRPNGSLKGKNTIYMCDLLRFAADEAALPSDPGDKRYDQLVGDLMARPGSRDAAMIIAALQADPAARAAGAPGGQT